MLNNTQIESPAVTPSEVVLRKFLKTFSRRLIIIGVEPKTLDKCEAIYLQYDWQNWTSTGTAAKIREYIKQNQYNTSFKFKRHRYSLFNDFAGEVFRPGSRAHRTTARQHRSYNNHWEFACNGVIFHITPTDFYPEYKDKSNMTKLAGINFRVITEEVFAEAKKKNSYDFSKLSYFKSDPVPLLWSNL